MGPGTARGIVIAALTILAWKSSAQIDLSSAAIEWRELNRGGDIVVDIGSIDGFGYDAFRGTAVIDAPVGRIVSVLLDWPSAPEWVYRLDDSVLLRDSVDGSVVWQRYGVPGSDRTVIYASELSFDDQTGVFLGVLRDIGPDYPLTQQERSRIPDTSGTVRATLVYSNWEVRAISPERTCVKVETLLDPNNYSRMFFRVFRRSWPRSTLSELMSQVLEDDIALHPVYGNWVPLQPETMINQETCMQRELAQ